MVCVLIHLCVVCVPIYTTMYDDCTDITIGIRNKRLVIKSEMYFKRFCFPGASGALFTSNGIKRNIKLINLSNAKREDCDNQPADNLMLFK